MNTNLFKNSKSFYVILLFLFSVSANQFYGFFGLNPVDSFASFNAGYDILNGHFPFKDFWTITGPLTSLIQAFFFKIFGVSWFSYVFHASVLNFILAISTFFLLYNFKLNINFCFFYSILISILAHPSTGTPYVDQQASYYSTISIFCFILALKTNLRIYWFFLPILFVFSFLCKQSPTAYIVIILSIFSIYYFIFNFNLNKIIFGIIGSATIISLFFFSLVVAEIPFNLFLEQYILFPITVGEGRYKYLDQIDFTRFFLRFKLIHIGTIVLIATIIKNTKKELLYLKSNEFIIIITLITCGYGFITHQLMTINGIFIFFIIPIFFGFSHIFYLKYFNNNKYILYLIIIIVTGSTIHYGNKYIHKRDFWDLRNVSLKNTINAEILDIKLKGLKWKTFLYPEDPREEIFNLKEAITVIKNDNRKKSLITDYQFISVILSIYDYSPSQVWWEFHVNPAIGTKYYKVYKNFFINKLIENDIEIIYVVRPLLGGENTVKNVLDENCFLKTSITKILDSYLLKKCNELKS